MTDKEALKLALEALKYHTAQTRPIHQTDQTMARCEEALAQPAQHREGHWCTDLTCSKCYSADFRLKHTTPPAAQLVGQAPCVRHCEATAFQIVIKNLRNEIERMKAAQRKPLTDEQIKEIWLKGKDHGDDWLDVQGIARAVEAAHGIKENT
jgi:hypothetical protein